MGASPGGPDTVLVAQEVMPQHDAELSSSGLETDYGGAHIDADGHYPDLFGAV